MNKKKWAFMVIIMGLALLFYYINIKPQYKISRENVKDIYCKYFDKNGYYSIKVSDSDKEMIIDEVSKMRKKSVSGEIVTINYSFVIELTGGKTLSFQENTKNIIKLYSQDEKSILNIKAPKTYEFIKRFTDENNIERY
ncbi:hypothetical protein [Clostridium intestinale]|uniref:Uncharacterized protein n=1 Tax=Clostridium intestinale URNW TaxID=1294142 RepID=U2Q2A2_9CLOT|nr:hypothetical protein [Clostridium intestinale]ERK30194.1 hypothetical protein CINTURNW_2217 [Clostridium intestinale URNW]